MKFKRLSGALAGVAIVAALLPAYGASASTPTAPRGAVTTSTQVHLITGDVVTLRTDPSGRQTASVAPGQRQGPAGVFQTFTIGHDAFVVPQSAAPYLGKTLDPSLFDVTQLARHPGSSLHVNLTLRPDAGAVSLPGATLHRTSATSATATFTASSARAFGTALARQAMRDHASANRASGMFASILKMSSSSGTAVRGSTHPADSYTLTVKGIDWNGNPDNGDSVNVYNVDDMTLYANSLMFTNGQAGATVPGGHYALVCFFYDFSTGNIYVTSIPQVTVSKDTTVTLDARKATSVVSITTKKPATPQILSVGWARTDALGQTGSFTFLAGGTNTFYVQPTKKKPSVGQLHYYVYSRMFSTGAKKPYTYDVKYPQNGTIKADQSYTVRQKSLATIHAGYAADHPNQLSLDTRFAALPWETVLFGSDLQFTTPLARTEYYTARPYLQWQATDFSVYTPDPFTLLGEIDTSWAVYTPGMKTSEIFRGQPTHPRLLEHPVYVNETICPVCATDSNLDVLAFPFADNSPNHRSYPDSAAAGLTETTNWAVKAGKKTVMSGTGIFNTAPALVKTAKSYKLIYNETRSSDDFLMSTDVKTTWKFKADVPQAKLPDGWVCDLNGGLNCGVVPVMTNNYNLPVNLLGQIKSGEQSGGVTIGHLADANIKVKKLTAALSYDGGKTWQNATLTRNGNGQYTIAFTVPKKSQTDGFGALKINAKDAAGGSLSQTILKAFSVK